MKTVGGALMLALLAAGASCPAACGTGSEENTISVSGAWALYPMMVRWGEEFSKVRPDVQFDISAGGAGKGMADALAGVVEIGMVSRDITPEEIAKGAFFIPVVKDAVFPTVSAKNPVLPHLMARGITRDVFVGIYMRGDVTTWGQVVGRPEITDPIHVYTRSDSAGAPETWAKYLGGKQENLKGIGVYGDPGLLDAVVKDPLGLGYNNLGYAYDTKSGQAVAGAAVAPIDANGDGKADEGEALETKTEAMEAVAAGRYPSPPARALNLVTAGKPAGLVAEFLQWALVDGQQFVEEAGYVPLTKETLAEALGKVR